MRTKTGRVQPALSNVVEGKRGIRIDISIATNNKAAPPDLKEWVADNVLAKFILEAVEVTDTAAPRST